MAILSSPIAINGIVIKNRIVMPPMVCFSWADESGIVTDRHVQHYGARAEGGAGLIIVEAACVNKFGRQRVDS